MTVDVKEDFVVIFFLIMLVHWFPLRLYLFHKFNHELMTPGSLHVTQPCKYRATLLISKRK